MVSSIIGFYHRMHMYRTCIMLMLMMIRCYLYMVDNIMYLLPTFIFSKTHIHRTSSVDFSVHEYLYNYNGRFYTYKIVESIDYDVSDYFNKIDIDKRNCITHACVINHSGEYIRDITSDIRHFIHLMDIIEWKYILVHLGIENEKKLLINKNDEELSEIYLDIDELYHKKFII